MTAPWNHPSDLTLHHSLVAGRYTIRPDTTARKRARANPWRRSTAQDEERGRRSATVPNTKARKSTTTVVSRAPAPASMRSVAAAAVSTGLRATAEVISSSASGSFAESR
jgi:hypothetical protein